MFLCHLCGCHNIILNLPWPISVSFTVWACPLALGWIDGKFHSEASVLISQPSDPLKEKEFLVQILAWHLLLCESRSLQKDQHQEGNISNAIKFNFSHLLFSTIFSPLLHRLKCLEFSDVSIEFKWLFKGNKFKWMKQRYFLSSCTQTVDWRSRDTSVFNLADYRHHGGR